MPDSSKKPRKTGDHPLLPREPRTRFDPRNFGARGKNEPKARPQKRGGRPPRFPGRTGGR